MPTNDEYLKKVQQMVARVQDVAKKQRAGARFKGMQLGPGRTDISDPRDNLHLGEVVTEYNPVTYMTEEHWVGTVALRHILAEGLLKLVMKDPAEQWPSAHQRLSVQQAMPPVFHYAMMSFIEGILPPQSEIDQLPDTSAGTVHVFDVVNQVGRGGVFATTGALFREVLPNNVAWDHWVLFHDYQMPTAVGEFTVVKEVDAGQDASLKNFLTAMRGLAQPPIYVPIHYGYVSPMP